MTGTFPIAYFGSIFYYKNLAQLEEISFELYEHYVKQTIRNRANILGANGVLNLSIPVIKPFGNKTITKDIIISSAENWQKNHWKAIESAYSPAPYFEHYESEVKNLIFTENENLVDFNCNIHNKIVDWLCLPTKTRFTTSYIVENKSAEDFRNLTWFDDHCVQYTKVFNHQNINEGELSILDAIFNLGPMTRNLLIDP